MPNSQAGWTLADGRELMSQADLLVVPSLWPEPFGLVGVEAGCLGLPSVAYAVGGIPDWLIAGVTGEIAPGDPPGVDGLAEAMVRALADPEHYKNLSCGRVENGKTVYDGAAPGSIGNHSRRTAAGPGIFVSGSIFWMSAAVQIKQDSPVQSVTGALPRLGLVCDYLEEGWPSMDLFGDMLAGSFRADHAGEIAVEQLRPPLHARFSRLPMAGGSPILWNVDRLLNRLYDYPGWLRNRAVNFDLFHIVDHSYAQLALELPAARTITTCHDLDTFRCLLEPELEHRPRWFRAMTRRILRGLSRSTHVIMPECLHQDAVIAVWPVSG